MKRYLIALYIPWMLFFLTGCYASQQLTFEELKDCKDSNEIYILSKEKQEYMLVNSNKPADRSGYLYCPEWIILEDSIKMTCSNHGTIKAAAKSPGKETIPEWQNYTLSKSDIDKISRKELNLVTTIIAVLIPTILVVALISKATAAEVLNETRGSFGY
jgi:hypothetical protein